MNVDLAQLQPLIAGLLWPLGRIAGLMLTAPILGANSIPVRVRVGIALILTLALAPLAQAPAQLDPLSLPALVVVAQQVVTGAAIGFALRLAFEAVALGGDLIASTMGLGFSQVVDPQSGASTPLMGQFYLVIASLLFLAMNGHLALIALLADGMRGHALATLHIGPDGLWDLLGWTTHLFGGAIRVALPALIALLIVNAGFGAISRAAPSMNLFAVGFPITITLGFVVIWLSLRTLPDAFNALLDSVTPLMRHLAGG
jgi:flagellar biosynthesis protein FliR